ncbi:MAG TPA: hypothetical protein VLR94_03675, partial [Acidobacteriota bacterium]|nr:hypothetical protein [Acidobacteriota bacterium]
MKTVRFSLIILCMLFAALAIAQDNGKGFVYGFGSLGAFSDGGGLLTHIGGGGEKMVTRNIGFGASVGYIAPVQNLSEGIGLLDVNGSYYFTRAQ